MDAVVKGGVAATVGAAQKGSRLINKATQLVKATILATKNKAQRGASAATAVAKDVFGVLTAALQLAGCIAKAGLDFAAAFVKECIKDAPALSRVSCAPIRSCVSPGSNGA